jgi:hypothetical protein
MIMVGRLFPEEAQVLLSPPPLDIIDAGAFGSIGNQNPLEEGVECF